MPTATSSAAKITFSDPFTGADASAPNARWTLRDAGWQIASNKLVYTGASFGIIFASCTPGNNTISVDIDFTLGSATFAIFSPRYVDGNNYIDVSLNVSEVLQIRELVAGSPTNTVTDPGGARLTNPCNVQVAVVGGLVTVTVTGGVNPGSFSNTVTNFASASLVALGMNTAKSSDTFDNFVLA